MENKQVFFEKFCDTYKQKIEALIEFENQDLEEIEEAEKKHTLTLLLAEICRLEDYCADPKVFEDTFQELQNKVESIIFVLKEMDKRILGLKAEEEQLAKTRKSLENKKENLKEYLKVSLLGSHFQKFATKNYVINFRKSESLKIEDLELTRLEQGNIVDLIEDGYVRSKTEFAWNKNKIKEDLKEDKLPEKLKSIASIETKLSLAYKERKE